MEKILSIIVPVYNKEMFLKECVESIGNLEISKDKIEALFIDDVSTDNSYEILKEYEKQNDFVKVIQLNENSGSPSKPRNVGIKEAKGEYVTFLDADDWLDTKGMPILINQVKENNSDIGFGQSIKHEDKSITKPARFTSFKVDNNLVPYEINKIFRAVGPPGKILKRSIIIDNNIEFKHMKYGEDKLFFIEAISKCKTASMNDVPVYHVNRYRENDSLVKQTDIIEKSYLNLDVLKEVLKLDLQETAEYQALSRIIELDFITRLFNRKRFLNRLNKQPFYDIFDEMLKVLEDYGKNIEDYISDRKIINIYNLLKNKEYEKLNGLINIHVKGGNASKYIKDNVIHYDMPESLSECLPIIDEFYATYNGTYMINNKKYEKINVYKEDEVKIRKVLLTEINNEPNQFEVDYIEKDNYILVESDSLNKASYNFNITIIYNEYIPFIVNMLLPNGNKDIKLNRQNFKAEFKVNNQNEMSVEDKFSQKYYIKNPTKVIITKKLNVYNDPNFDEKMDLSFSIGELVDVEAIAFSSKGTPRLHLTNGTYITANKLFVKEIAEYKDSYLYDIPKRVSILKKCKEYNSPKFEGEIIRGYKVNDEVDIESIVMSPKLTPRLKTRNGFITANKEFVRPID
ncbi:glycosyltransferase family 2 protein [Mammaliicoccus sciuri]|uniref:glycosyltransferase family 2 protein n=1 Tax=Mammaliicoccus TaxID=2803850 RepID=UPI0018CB3764|nr:MULTISPECIES: glycosyltransferase family 2 protein [Mammaliicoccus]MBG9209193.1 glycosyltransferase family 2 protein [Mammaliicoccus sciuri]MDT0744071.1 glycosyltransferase family 2 protein [Mammaliicoccus sciuri]MDT0750955.1 glycosyltransferase family 2 protein [Mammaliicoccus sciuri]